MPTATVYFPEEKLDLFVWFRSLPKEKRSKMAVSALEAVYKSDGKAKPRDIKKALTEQRTAEVENMKGAVMRMFADVPTAPKELKEWLREAGGGSCVGRRLDDVCRKQPDTMKKEARFYFMEQFPELAKAAGMM